MKVLCYEHMFNFFIAKNNEIIKINTNHNFLLYKYLFIIDKYFNFKKYNKIKKRNIYIKK